MSFFLFFFFSGQKFYVIYTHNIVTTFKEQVGLKQKVKLRFRDDFISCAVMLLYDIEKRVI